MIKETVMTKAETKTVQFTKADKIKFSILVSTILTVALSVVYNIISHGIHCTF
jgi:cell division protein FtsL